MGIRLIPAIAGTAKPKAGRIRSGGGKPAMNDALPRPAAATSAAGHTQFDSRRRRPWRRPASAATWSQIRLASSLAWRCRNARLRSESVAQENVASHGRSPPTLTATDPTGGSSSRRLSAAMTMRRRLDMMASSSVTVGRGSRP